MRPPFLRAVPDEIERYGGTGAAIAAAAVLALIRWRCETPGPGRIQDDSGCCWWRVSHGDLAAEAGLTVHTARTALRRLTADGAVVAKQLARTEDQTRAYRVADTGSALTSQLGHSQQADQPVGPQPEGVWAVARGGVGYSPTALPIETFETKRDRAGAHAGQPSEHATAAGKREPAKCPEHPVPQHWCRRCKPWAAWEAEVAKARRAAVSAVRAHDIAACDQCDENGMRHVDAGRCRLHRNLDDLG